MTTIASTGVSSFGVVSEAELQILDSHQEEMKTAKTSVQYKQKVLEKHHEERIDNLEDRIKTLGKGHSGCLKFLKIITFVAAAVAAPFSFGASLGVATGVATALQIAAASLGAIGAIATGLQQLQQAMKDKKLLLNQAEGQQIMAIIQETQKWIEDDQNLFKEASNDQQQSLEEFKMTLNDLEQSFSAMLQIGKEAA